jgi:spore photoproduct lyase
VTCKTCKYREEPPNDGICLTSSESDRLPIRCVGEWSKDKYYYLRRYIYIFTTSMRNKWEGLCYVDLFSGPGKSRVRQTGEEIDGSPLISLQAKFPFSKYIFTDSDNTCITALKKRITTFPNLAKRTSIILGDCNKDIDKIIGEIPSRSLSLAFADPTGLDLHFQTIQKLTEARKVDLIIIYPEGMALKRNIDKFLKTKEENRLDLWIGDNRWRELYKTRLKQFDDKGAVKAILEYYRQKLKDLGYKQVKSGEEVTVRSSAKRLPLYLLLFASKHRRGHEFWAKIGEVEPSGQTKLKLNNPSAHLANEISTLNVPTTKLKIHYSEYMQLDGRKEILVGRVNDGSIVARFEKTSLPVKPTDVVCPHFLELKWAYGCPFDCSWCYLKGTFRFRPEGIEPVVKDYKKIKLHTEVFLQEVKNPEILNTGEIADSLMHENSASPFSKFIIPIFETQRLHKVLFLTKSSNVKNLLDIYPHKQTIISFSLNAIPVAEQWERAPSVMKRIEAATKVYEAGYEVRIRIDPMVPIDNWKKHYIQLLDIIFGSLNPERITFGSLRGLQSTINGCTDKSWIRYLKESSNWGKKIDFETRFAMYSAIIEYLNKKSNYNKIALCKETVEMWDRLKINYRKIKCNCTL